MDATTPQSVELQLQQDRKRKRKAILAGGVVLGLCAAVTLAAWSDDVFADGVFTTDGVFILEGSDDPYTATDFRQAETSDVASGDPLEGAIRLQFSGTNLTPGDTAYAPFSIRLTENSTLDGTLNSLTSTATGPLSAALRYSITSGATSCAAGNVTGTSWVSDATVNGGATNQAGTALGLTANSDGTTGIIVPLCVTVTFPNTPEAKDAVDSADVAADTRIVWDFYGEPS